MNLQVQAVKVDHFGVAPVATTSPMSTMRGSPCRLSEPGSLDRRAHCSLHQTGICLVALPFGAPRPPPLSIGYVPSQFSLCEFPAGLGRANFCHGDFRHRDLPTCRPDPSTCVATPPVRAAAHRMRSTSRRASCSIACAFRMTARALSTLAVPPRCSTAPPGSRDQRGLYGPPPPAPSRCPPTAQLDRLSLFVLRVVPANQDAAFD